MSETKVETKVVEEKKAAAAPAKKRYLTDEQVKYFHDTGILIIRAEQIWTPEELKTLISSVDAMDTWPDAPGKWMKYYEKNKAHDKDPTAPAKMLQRIENFTQYSPGLSSLLNGDKLIGMSSELFGEDAILYKEKINFKLPGGAGFAPHQDVSAGWWMYNQSIHLSTLITIDEATAENGCLDVVLGEHKKGKLAPDWKEIPEDVCARLKWVPAPTKPGDVIFFDSYVPHRSGPNNTDKSRRVLYATYAKRSEGDFRDQYYADKRKSFPPDCERDPTKNYEYKI